MSERTALGGRPGVESSLFAPCGFHESRIPDESISHENDHSFLTYLYPVLPQYHTYFVLLSPTLGGTLWVFHWSEKILELKAQAAVLDNMQGTTYRRRIGHRLLHPLQVYRQVGQTFRGLIWKRGQVNDS